MSIYRVYCIEEGQYYTTTTNSVYDPHPTECPNNPSHTIDTNLTQLVKSVISDAPQGFSWSSGIDPESILTVNGGYVTMLEWIYPGSFSFTPTNISIMARIGIIGTADVRIIDSTNGDNVIIEQIGAIDSTSYQLINMTGLSNLSDAPAIWSLQVRRGSLVNLTIFLRAVQVWQQ